MENVNFDPACKAVFSREMINKLLYKGTKTDTNKGLKREKEREGGVSKNVRGEQLCWDDV